MTPFLFFKYASYALISIFGLVAVYYFGFSKRGYSDADIYAILLISAIPVFILSIYWVIHSMRIHDVLGYCFVALTYILIIIFYVIGY